MRKKKLIKRLLTGSILAVMALTIFGCGTREPAPVVNVTEQAQEETSQAQTSQEETSQEKTAQEESRSETSDSLDEVSETVEDEMGVEPKVLVRWAEDVENLTEYEEYSIDSESEPLSRIVFTTDRHAENFTVLELMLVDVSENGSMEFEAYPVLLQVDELNPDQPVVVELTFMGDIPCYGFQYEDENGSLRRFALEISGENGALLVRESDRKYFNFVISSDADLDSPK